MSCIPGIAKAITSTCDTQPVGGLEVVAYIWNRVDMAITYDGTDLNKVTGIVAVGAAVMYKFIGIKKSHNAGHDGNFPEDLADDFKHYFSMKGFESDTDSVANFDALADLCVAVEYKQKSTSGDGVFVGYGLKSGLYKTSDTRRANENNGTRSMELATKNGEGEPYSQYNILITDYATTKATLEALLS